MKNLFLFLLFALLSLQNVLAQSTNANVLDHPKYLENPAKYLSQLDTSKIKSEVLIDRVIYDNTILNVNGWDKVTSIAYSDWYKIYANLKFASGDTAVLPVFDVLREISHSMEAINNEVVIGLIDYQFKRISQPALNNGDFVQGDNFLNDNNASVLSYTSERVIAASCLSHNIYGDQVKFKLSPFFYFGNNTDEALMSVQTDFGNGQGFQAMNFDEPLLVNFNGQSNYIEVNVKLLYENMLTQQQQTRYARFSVYRQGVEGIPTPSALPKGGQLNIPAGGLALQGALLPDPSIINGNKLSYYPEKITKTYTAGVCYIKYRSSTTYVSCEKYKGQPGVTVVTPVIEIIPEQYALEVAILYAPENTSGKLRRPFIMVDGFDNKNTRNYYKTNYDDPNSLLPYQKDFRGLYKYLNGQPSPWAVDVQPEAGLADDLRDQGFDLIFINFMYGTGSVYKNAKLLQDYLNNVLNSPQFRDAETEEMVLVGPSMGGLITRLTLTAMEKGIDLTTMKQTNPIQEHFVKSWISFDSPHKGANIPPSLQQAILFGSKFTDSPLGGKNPAIVFEEKLKVLNQDATKQLLMHHYSTLIDVEGNISSPYMLGHSNHYALQDYFNILGFPSTSKNYAITNGGTKQIYTGRQQIFKVEGKFIGKISAWWTLLEGWGGSHDEGKVFHGERIGYVNSQELTLTYCVNYDNVPGGWNDAFYIINFDKKNVSDLNKGEIDVSVMNKATTWSTFIPTSSAFGVIENTIAKQRALVSKNWDSFTNCNDSISGKIKTPFDEIYGMPGRSEQHMAITSTTSKFIQEKWFIPELVKTTFPTIRSGVKINKTVSKPVSYNLTESVSYAGNGNTFTTQTGADVKINAGKSITFLPGFTATAGTKVEAKIKIVHAPGSHTLKTGNDVQQHKNSNYLKDSPYLNKVYSYAQTETPTVSNILQATIYPNPATNFIGLDITGSTENQTRVELYNGLGELMLSENINNDGVYNLDISSFASGVYFVKITSTASSSVFQSKIIKL